MTVYEMSRISADGKDSFGIDVYCNGKPVKSIPGIGESAEEITELVEMCNSLEVEICQIDDIVEDYLTDFTL